MNDGPRKPYRGIALGFLKWTGVLFTVVLVVAVSLYLLSPWLIRSLAPTYAERFGLTTIELTVGRPGLHGIRIKTFHVTSDKLDLDGQDAQLSYDIRELLQGRVVELAVGSVAVTIKPGLQTEGDNESLVLSDVIDSIPFKRLAITDLRLAVPAIGFLGTGSASKDADAITFLMEGIEPEEASYFRVSANVTKENLDFRFAERGAPAGSDFLSLRGVIRDDEIDVGGVVNLNGYALSLASAIAELPAGTGNVSGSFNTQLPWPLPSELPIRQVSVDFPAYVIDWVSEDGNVAIKNLVGSLNIVPGKFLATASGTLYKRIDKDELTITLPPSHAFAYENFTLSGGAGLRVRLQQPTGSYQAQLRSYSYRESQDANEPDRARVDADVTVSADNLKSAGRLDTEFSLRSLEPLDINGQADFNGKVTYDEQTHETGVQSVFSLKADNLSIDGTLTSGVFKKAFVGFDYNTGSGAGDFTATNTLKFTKPLAAALIPGWDSTYDLDSGRMEASLALTWKTLDKIMARLDLTLADCRAHYDDYVATGVNGQLNFRSPDFSNTDLWSLEPSTLHIETLETGLTVNNLHTAFTWSGNRLQVSKLEMAILGGKADTTPFDYEIDTGKAVLKLMLHDLNLADILALEGDDILGSGTVDGELPITITNGQARVDNGSLVAQPPGGFIRTPARFSTLTGQPGLDFAMLALNDFKYTDLSSEISYTESGDITLAVHLKGRNPAVEKGRAIQYNLTITENIPVLLESLRLQDSLTERIEMKTRQ